MALRLALREQRFLANASEILLSPASFGSEVDWHTAVMTALMPLTGAHKSAIRVAEPGGFRMTPLGFEVAAIAEHKDYYHRFDFGRALGEKPVLSEVFSRNEHYGRELPRFRRTEYYCDYIAKYEAFDTICLSTRAHEHEKGVVLYLWHKREHAVDKRSAALGVLRLLAPSFRAGIILGAQIHRHRQDLLASFDACSDGCAIFSSQGVLLHRNSALSLILADADGHAELSNTIVQIALTIRNAHIHHRGLPENVARLSDLHRIGSGDYAVSACILEMGFAGGPAILVTVTPRGRRPLNASQSGQLRDRFGLTQRELEVAILLRSRHTNHEIARCLGVSEHTARHHTENVLRKLGLATRTEVGRVIGSNASQGLTKIEKLLER